LNGQPEIDETDVKILKILQANPRTSYSQIAETCETSIDKVRRRYEQLRKEGVIVSEVMGFHPKSRGFECFAWIGIITQPGKEKYVLKTLEEESKVSQNFVEIGTYNIRCLVMLKSIDGLPDFVDALKKNQYINNVDVMIWTNIEEMAHPTNLVIRPFPAATNNDESGVIKDIKISSKFIQKQKGKQYNKKLKTKDPKFDLIDQTIMRVLSLNARTPFRTIAKQLGISTKTAILRYEKLKRDWIWYSTLSLNFEKLGYAGHVSSLIKVSNKNWVSEVFSQLIQIPNVIVAMRLLGPYDIDVLSPFSTTSELMDIKQAISEIPGIERVNYQIGESLIWPPLPTF